MTNTDSASHTTNNNPDFAAIFDAVASPCVIIAPDFTIVAGNKAFLNRAKLDPQNILGRNVFDVFPPNPEFPGADGTVNLRASITRVFGGKVTEEMPTQRYDIPVPGDPTRFAERYWKAINIPIFNNTNDVTHVLHQVEDVTNEVQAAEAAVRLRAGLSSPENLPLDQKYMSELFHQSPSLMAMLVGPSHRVEFVNVGYRTLIGHRDILGSNFSEGTLKAAPPGQIKLLDNVYRSGAPLAVQGQKYDVQAVPGGAVNQRFFDFIYQPFRNAAGQVIGILMQGIDATERVMAETRRNAFARLNEVLSDHSSPEEIIFQASAILGEALGVSRVGYGTFNREAESLHVVRDWNAEGVSSLAGTLNLRDFGSFIDEMKEGKFIVVNDVTADARTQEAAAALRKISASAFVNAPVLDQGKVVAVIFVNSSTARNWAVEDLSLIHEVAERTRMASERLRSEIAMRLSEAKFRTIADAMPQMVWSTLADGFHDYYNEQWYAFTGVRGGATDGDGWNDLFHPEDQQRAWETWRRCLTTGDTYEIQYRLRYHSGEYRWVLGRALPIRNDAGAIVRWMGTCTDIHAQKLAEVELEQASRRKDEFLAMLAHELRNPLAPISTAAQLLRIQSGNEARVQQASEIITRQVKHMTDLVDDLLDVSRVTRGLVELQLQTLDLKLVINGAVEQARPLIESRHHQLLLRIPSAQTHVRGDKTRLVQAISNLLNNAAKYTQQKGEISLALELDGANVCIRVADNGIGMDAALLPSVFDLFTQAERTPDRAQGGLGLGLALVQTIATLHHGSVSAASAGVGHGSTFTMTLPLVQADMTALAAAAPEATAMTPRRLRVMVVDDNRDAATAIGALLETASHDVLVCEDAESALSASEHSDIDVFILDIGLPIMDGYELARRLRAKPGSARSLLVALTGYDQAHDYVLSKTAGFDHHFVKPLDVAQLWTVLARWGSEREIDKAPAAQA